jgi:cellulose synthase/poly-beta-1,6-N-acetylglucosamine synthase-like glycosyltransferase
MGTPDLIGLLAVVITFIPQTLFYISHTLFFNISKRFKNSFETIEENYKSVSFIVPVRKEPLEYVEKLLEYVEGFKLPQYEVIIVSDDDEIVKEELFKKLHEWRSKGFNAWLIWRRRPIGFKSGALNTGLYASIGDYVFPLDVDCRPEKCLLGKSMGLMEKNPSVIGVVGRWEPLDLRERLSQAVGLTMKAMVEILFKGRSALGLSVFPLGTGTVFKSKPLKEELKGWDINRIQDDMEIGCRIIGKGYRIEYLDNCKAYVEVPSTYKSLRIQQSRWAYGATDVAISRFKNLMTSPQRLLGKIEALTFLLQYLPAMLAFLGTIMLATLSLVTRKDYIMKYYFVFATWVISQGLYGYALYSKINSVLNNRWDTIVNIGRNAAIAAALTPYLSWSVLKALLRLKITYKRTPKGVFERVESRARIPVEFITGSALFTVSIYLLLTGGVLTGLWVLLQSLGYLYVSYRWPDSVFKS